MFAKLLLLPFVALSLAALPTSSNSRTAGTDVTVEDAGDGFYLSETQYDKKQSFVYTAVANFENGNAAALAFGAEDGDHYWVFNVDRHENHTKLLYFSFEGGTKHVEELKIADVIGNDKMKQSERNLVNPKVASNPRYHLKMVLTVEEASDPNEKDKVYAEFFIDNIKRFGVDDTIDLNSLQEGLEYQGGYLGFNVFASRTRFTDITYGKSDYSYYTELYRNQYHYSQFSHWNNDPNGLVYYNGWYHMFYQTHPFSKQWADMYWGHARSRDLVHWQELPIALFPDDGTMDKGLGNGMAWSGIAMVYHQGMSSTIDEKGWFPNGEGLLGFYTRDGAAQDQVAITSTDEGLTWIKQDIVVSQYIMVPGNKVDCRDPSIFPLEKSGDKVTTWGMVLSGGTQNKIWFLKSNDLFSWSLAGQFDYVYPECVTVKELPVSGLDESYYMMSVSSRYYALGTFTYTAGQIKFILTDGTDVATLGNAAFRKMDYGEDSYAAQCFYIDDTNSKYYGKSICVSWFSGLPSDAESGIYANVRDPWNGGGMTIPVELGIDKVNDEYYLTQKPITIDNTDFDKESIVSETNLPCDGTSNPLEDVNTHIFELDAVIDNPNEESVEFRVAESDDEYTAFGWNKTEGYYVDRGHTSDAGIHFNKGYHHRFTTGPTLESTRLTFYALCDNGGLELFLGDYRYNFYNLILPNPTSIGASFTSSGNVTFDKLKVNSIGSVWYDELEEGQLLVNKERIQLDLTLHNSEDLLAYSTNGEAITYEVTSGTSVASVSKTNKGALVTALSNGNAVIKVSTPTQEKNVSVKVDNATVDCFFTPTKSNIVSGIWMTTSNGLVAKENGGDGYLISDSTSGDFTCAATFDLTNAQAAGILLRTNKAMTSYIMVNFDKNENVCKIWSPLGEIGRANASVSNLSNVGLSVKTSGRNIVLSLNGNEVINAEIHSGDPLTGYFGLNVFNGSVTFSKVGMLKESYDYDNRDLTIVSTVDQYIRAIYNTNKNNELIHRDFYSVSGSNITIKKEYFYTLSENTMYSFYVEGELASFTIKVYVTNIDYTPSFVDRTIEEGVDLTLYIGSLQVTSISVNAKEVAYIYKQDKITISSDKFEVGENTVTVNGTYSFKLTVKKKDTKDITPAAPTSSNGCGGSILTTSVILSVISVIGASLILIKRKERKND